MGHAAVFVRGARAARPSSAGRRMEGPRLARLPQFVTYLPHHRQPLLPLTTCNVTCHGKDISVIPTS